MRKVLIWLFIMIGLACFLGAGAELVFDQCGTSINQDFWSCHERHQMAIFGSQALTIACLAIAAIISSIGGNK